MNLIHDLGEIHNILVKNTFDTLLTALNSRFYQFFSMERTRWESGKYYDYNSLANYTRSIYNNMVLNRI